MFIGVGASGFRIQSIENRTQHGANIEVRCLTDVGECLIDVGFALGTDIDQTSAQKTNEKMTLKRENFGGPNVVTRDSNAAAKGRDGVTGGRWGGYTLFPWNRGPEVS